MTEKFIAGGWIAHGPQGWSRSGIAPVQSQERGTTMQQGRILGIGGIFFKSANQQQMQEWYAKHLGLADSGHGAMLPWREKDNPESEQTTRGGLQHAVAAATALN
jgi:hypothetical protein